MQVKRWGVLSVVGVYCMAVALLPELALAEVKLPTWANSGNLENELASKGQKVANTIALVVGILGVIGMMIGAGQFTLQRHEQGKSWIGGGVVGLVIAGSVFGIAKLFA